MGISYGDYEPTVRKKRELIVVKNSNTNLDAKCIVQFRPNSKWKGEYGFDWFRIGDTDFDGDTNYETLIGRYYDKALTDASTQINDNGNIWTKNFKADPQPAAFSRFDRIEELKRTYGVFTYSLEKDSAGDAIEKQYYKPVIALLPVEADPKNLGKFIETGKAKLELYLEFEKKEGVVVKPNKLVFEMDGVLMDDKHTFVSIDKHTIEKGDLAKKIDVEITCKTDFTDDKEIKVWAITMDNAGNQTAKLQAGVLKMIAPAKKITKNIVVVLVKTEGGTGNPASLDIFTRNLKQAFIKTNITIEGVKGGHLGKIEIDLSIPSNNLHKANFDTACNVDRTSKFHNIRNRTQLDYLLVKTLERDYNGQFDNHFKLFFLANGTDMVLDENEEPKGYTAGYSHRDTDYGVMLWGHNKYTISHECLHGLGLPHSFFGDSFLYKALKTDNIMDYSHLPIDTATGLPNTPIDRIATWYWQWKIKNPNIT
jgi:hypothetical protein